MAKFSLLDSIVSVCLFSLIYYLQFRFFRWIAYRIGLKEHPEAAVPYTCDAPEIEGEGKDWPELEKSSIKVKPQTPPTVGAASKVAGARRKRPPVKRTSERASDNTVQVEGSSVIRCYDPSNGQNLGVVNPSTNNGIDRAIEQAAEAQKAWAKTSFESRRKVLKTLLEFILKNKDYIVEVACIDSGKTRVDAVLGEILVTLEKLQWTIDHGENALKPETRPTNRLMFYKANEVHWEPLGVVGACVSWNYPFHNFMGPVISALFAGDAIVVKSSEQTAWSSTYWLNICRGALKACGHNPFLVQSIICWPGVADHLTSHPGISHLTFIGSHPVAHQVAKSASKSLTPLCLELGGKDPAIILDDVGSDLDRIVATLIRGVFQSAGQNCIGIERIICLPKTYWSLINAMVPIIKSLRPGRFSDANVDVGACISDTRFAHLEALIADAVADGASLLKGTGMRYNHPRYPKGHYFTPSLLYDVTPSMRIAREELFAPVALIMPASSTTEAIEIANATPYALGASVFGRKKADVEKVVAGVRAGMVSVNDFASYYAVQLPFGGAKGSGYGRFAGTEGLRSLCNAKSVCADRWPLIKTSIPSALRVPYADGRMAYRVAGGIVKMGYEERCWAIVEGYLNFWAVGGETPVRAFFFSATRVGVGVWRGVRAVVGMWVHGFRRGWEY